MKTLELAVNGSFYLSYLDLDGEPLDDPSLEETIHRNLADGKYVISMNDRKVFELSTLKWVYGFNIDNVSDSTEYYFDVLDED